MAKSDIANVPLIRPILSALQVRNLFLHSSHVQVVVVTRDQVAAVAVAIIVLVPLGRSLLREEERSLSQGLLREYFKYSRKSL